MAVTAHNSGTKTPPAVFTVTMTNTSDSILSSANHGLAVGDRVTFYRTPTTGGVIPTLTEGQEYYVVNVPDATHFKVSATEGGGAITIASTTRSNIRCDPEYVVDEVHVAGIFEYQIDLVNLADGDYFEFYVYDMVLTAGTRRVLWSAGFGGAQSAKNRIQHSIPIPNELSDTGALQFTIKAVRNQASRAIPWKVIAA